MKAGEVYQKFMGQPMNFDAAGRVEHLKEIYAAPESTWVLLALFVVVAS